MDLDGYTSTASDNAISKLNAGGLIILRINDLWKEVHRYATKGNYRLWNEYLDRIWCELGGDVKEGDDDDKKYTQLCMKYTEALATAPEKQDSFTGVTPEMKLSFAKQKVVLLEKELFLRRLENKQGKGTAYYDSADDYMD